MGLKENIKKFRLDNNMTLEEVANKLGVSKPTVQRYESGVISNIPQDNIEKLAEIFNISPSELMGWGLEISCKGKKINLDPKTFGGISDMLFKDPKNYINDKKLEEIYEITSSTIKTFTDATENIDDDSFDAFINYISKAFPNTKKELTINIYDLVELYKKVQSFTEFNILKILEKSKEN